MKNKVKDIMSRNVVTIQNTTPFSEACRFFQEFSIHHLPVKDNNHRIIGMFTSSDALKAYTDNTVYFNDNTNKTIDDIVKVDEMMSTYEVYTIEPNATIKAASDLMHDKNVHSLLVYENDLIEGIVTNSDLINYYRALG